MEWGPIVSSLISLIAGGIIGLMLERARSAREDRARRHAERRGACANFLDGTDEWMNLEYAIATELGLLRSPCDWQDASGSEEPLLRTGREADDQTAAAVCEKVQRLRPDADRAKDRSSAGLRQIEFLLSEPTAEAAKEFRRRVIILVATVQEFPPRHCGAAHDAVVASGAAVEGARRRFVMAVRDELDVGAMPGS